MCGNFLFSYYEDPKRKRIIKFSNLIDNLITVGYEILLVNLKAIF